MKTTDLYTYIVFSILFFASLLQGCSTAKVRVLPGEDGIHRVESRDIERDSAEEEALDAANDYCEKTKQRAVFIQTEKTQYTGSMDENTRKTVRNASKAAMILGGPVGVASESVGAGAILGGAGTVGYSMTSDRDYKAELKFKCVK